MVKNFKLSYLNDLKDREIRMFTTYYNHSFIKFANNDYVIFYTITKGTNLKSLYILRKEDLILVEEFCYHKSFICDSNETFGLGNIYNSQFLENNDILKLFYNRSIYDEFYFQPQISNILNNYQSKRFDSLLYNLKDSNDSNFDINNNLKNRVLDHKYINYHGNLYDVNTEGYISKVDNKSYSFTNIHNTEVFEFIINKID